MNKFLYSGFLILFSASVMADASVDVKGGDKTFLLNAPGTLSGIVKGGSDDHGATPSTTTSAAATGNGTLPEQKADETPRFPPQQRFAPPPRQYRYVEDNERKFRQFGQTSGQNNPWFEQNNPAYGRPSQPMTRHPITNPWQLGGMPSMSGAEIARPDYSMTPYSSYPPGGYYSQNQMYPNYPDGIYRDTNPALLGMPGQSGFLPGFGGDNFPLPFSPFGMF